MVPMFQRSTSYSRHLISAYLVSRFVVGCHFNTKCTCSDCIVSHARTAPLIVIGLTCNMDNIKDILLVTMYWVRNLCGLCYYYWQRNILYYLFMQYLGNTTLYWHTMQNYKPRVKSWNLWEAWEICHWRLSTWQWKKFCVSLLAYWRS